MDGLPPERRRWAVAAMFTALAMASLDTAIANIALPAIATDLHVSPADVVWVVNVYQIALVATLLPLGALGEIVGHQRIYLCGLALFTLASLGCAAHRASPALVIAALVIALVLGWLVTRRQTGHPAPMLPIDLFRIPVFALSALTAVCSFAVQGLTFVALPFYFEDVLMRSQGWKPDCS
jgi:MFS family permease